MARRTGGTHKGVEDKRRSLPIYQHYTLSPGKTKSHHPEAKCNHCLKEFVCGSKQRLIRHLRKCNSISNPEEIIAETLNTLISNSATGTLNHSILEASNLTHSQISHHQLHHSHHHQLVGQQQIHHSPASSTTITTANSNINNVSNHNTSGSSSNDTGLIACSSNGAPTTTTAAMATPNPVKRRGRKPTNQSLASASPSIHVTTGLDGKAHFTPASQLPSTISGTVAAPLIAQVHNGRQVGYSYHSAAVSTTAAAAAGAHLSNTSGHLGCATTNHSAAYKLNPDPIDRAYLKLVLTRNLPLSLCDTKEFQLWVKTFANDYKPPSSINLIAHNLKQEAQAAKQRISNILVKAPKKTVNLELHSWHDQFRGHLWFSIVASMEHKRFLISIRDINLQLQNSSSNHQSVGVTSDKVLAEFIDECIKRIGSDRINSLVSEGDTFSMQARKSLYTTHPSIVTYYCWWNFTNLLCSDVIEHNEIFQNVMRNSNRLINFVSKQPRISQSLEKFSPFAGASGSICPKKNDRRWYSHLVCYLLEYIKNNNEAIIRALEAYSTSSTQSHLSSDNNNNSASEASNNAQSGIQQTTNTTTSTQQRQAILCHEDTHLIEINSIIMSSEYWTNLNLALIYLKPFHDIVALTSNVPTQQNNVTNNNTNPSNVVESSPVQQLTPAVSPIVTTNLSLSDYMHWFLKYGKILFDSWRQSPDSFKYQLIGRYLLRLNSSISEFKLLIAAYLLNPKHKCAFMTQRAKNTAIEEILNIASEFMPEESDGHTIFDQWKLYLVREEPYDMAYEESRSTPLEWWMSLPCAESIRRVALRILRLKAFTSPKAENLFSQLYFYEDESKSSLNSSSFEDVAILRYFFDFEDKIGQSSTHATLHNHTAASTNGPSSVSSNGYQDRTLAGQLHNQHQHQLNHSTNYLHIGNLSSSNETNGEMNDSTLSLNDGRQSFSDTFSDVVVDSYLNHDPHLTIETQSNLDLKPTMRLEDLVGYDMFTQFIDYNEIGVQIVIEEPIEKKKRKWTAQEILSKCQSNHQNNNNNEIK